MSLFLGKIHYWLFDKILWFEGLESDVINLAKSENLDVETLSKDINEKYGEKLPNKPLEDMIDTSNIHGWLQEKISSAEGRMAAWTSKILENDKNDLSKLEKIYIEQGIKAGNEVNNSFGKIDNAVDLYNKINDYILDGMPCDRVNEVLTSDENIVKWKRTICVHKSAWEKEGVNVNDFYNLRNLWIKSFVETINNEFKYTQYEDDIFSIEKQ
ncbi:hypothetical protein [Clostridium sp.]|uniref:hypothetical protein n=1 Tax=Clostridium sp. TaxID=1506 RepID=UPI00283FB53B|nr:hypothetical protein [Clostridium sp.]MDR3595180.1 hypothetical protein [Clostridium sp.]